MKENNRDTFVFLCTRSNGGFVIAFNLEIRKKSFFYYDRSYVIFSRQYFFSTYLYLSLFVGYVSYVVLLMRRTYHFFKICSVTRIFILGDVNFRKEKCKFMQCLEIKAWEIVCTYMYSLFLGYVRGLFLWTSSCLLRCAEAQCLCHFFSKFQQYLHIS